MSRSHKVLSFLQVFPTKTVTFFSSTRALQPFHLTLLGVIIRTAFGEEHNHTAPQCIIFSSFPLRPKYLPQQHILTLLWNTKEYVKQKLCLSQFDLHRETTLTNISIDISKYNAC